MSSSQNAGTMSHLSLEFRIAYFKARGQAQSMTHGTILSELAISYDAVGHHKDPRRADFLFGRIDGLTDGLIAEMPPGTAEPMFDLPNKGPSA